MHRFCANTIPFYIRDFSIVWLWYSRGETGAVPEPILVIIPRNNYSELFPSPRLPSSSRSLSCTIRKNLKLPGHHLKLLTPVFGPLAATPLV